MDHTRQIPLFGPAWHDMLECFTTLAHVAAVTDRMRVGPLVAGITHRNVAHLAKQIATLDVLSGGRVVCGLGAAWWKEEHDAYGLRFPPTGERFAMLEDALQLLPAMWGPGNKPFTGQTISVHDTTCYPRPVQTKVPILVGGSGERRTLRLVARYADACNLIGGAPFVAKKLAVLQRHCTDLGRDPETIEVTQLSPALIGSNGREVAALLDAHRGRRRTVEQYAKLTNAGTVADHIERFRELAAVGVDTAIMSLPNLDGPGPPIELAGEVIAAFS